MAQFPQTFQELRTEFDLIAQMNDDQVRARHAEWVAEKIAADAEPEGSERYYLAWKAGWRYSDELRAIRVDELRAKGDSAGEFALAMGIGLTTQEDL